MLKRMLKRIFQLIAIVLVLAYILLIIHAAVKWKDDPKGPPAWQEWEDAYGHQPIK